MQQRPLLFIFRDDRMPLRGTVDEVVTQGAFQLIEEDSYFVIFIPAYYPGRLRTTGSGRGHSELKVELEDVRGEDVWIGADPLLPDGWKREDDDEVLAVSVDSRDAWF